MILSFQNIDRIKNCIIRRYFCYKYSIVRYFYLDDDKIINKILSHRTNIEFLNKWKNIKISNDILINILKYIQNAVGHKSYYYFPDDKLYVCLGDRNDFLCIEEVLLGLTVEFHVEFEGVPLDTMKDLIVYMKFKD